jgi:hypothetical protein
MSFPQRNTDREKYEQACFTYLRFVFNGAPNSFIRAAAMEVFKWTLYPRPMRRDDDTVH